MNRIWIKKGRVWGSHPHQAFENEAALHRLIEENPQLLPLDDSLGLTVLGSEVPLENGSADILAVESNGRPVIIEVKLAQNSDARRSIVSQILTYAASLRGLSVEDLEKGPLSNALEVARHGSIFEAVKSNDPGAKSDAGSFNAAMQEFLDAGNFRLVFALDEIPEELNRIVAYFNELTVHSLLIDLVTIRLYEVNGAIVALPQRASLDFSEIIRSEAKRNTSSEPLVSRSNGSDAFRNSVQNVVGKDRQTFDRLIEWAEELTALPKVQLLTSVGPTQCTLAPQFIPGKVGLVTIYNYKDQPSLYVYRTVFERLAPNSIEAIERLIAPDRIGQGTGISDITPEVLETLAEAYREACRN